MNSLFDFANTVVYSDGTRPNISVAFPPNLPTNNYIEYKIPKNQEFRPDKIAYELYGDENASWILDEINHFYNGFSDYSYNRTILYLDLDTLTNLGIL